MKLQYTFKSKQDLYNFVSEIVVTGDYDSFQDSIDNIEVKFWDMRRQLICDLTEYFEMPPFAEIIAVIPWHEIFHEKTEADEAAARVNEENEFTQLAFFNQMATITNSYVKTNGINL